MQARFEVAVCCLTSSPVAAAEEEVRLPPLLPASGLLRLAGTAAHRSMAAALWVRWRRQMRRRGSM